MTADLYRYKVILSGWQGAPGLSQWFLRFDIGPVTDALVTAGAADIAAVYNALKGFGLDSTQARIDPTVDVIRDSDGVLQGQKTITPPAVVTSVTTGSALPRSSMIKIRATTDKVIVNDKGSHLLRGGIYYGPIAGTAVDNNGQIQASVLAAIPAAFGGILDVAGNARWVIWHRPSAVGATDGDSGFVQQVAGKPAPAVLRSRRD